MGCALRSDAHVRQLSYYLFNMPFHLRGIAALLVVTLVWGTTFPAMKELSGHFSPAWIIFIRFILGGVLLSPFLLYAKRVDIAAGAVLGLILVICFAFQLQGLLLTSANRNAFITGLNVLVVPLLGLIAGRAPERRIVVAIMLAIAGLFALCWDGGVWSKGDTLALWGAIFFGLYVKVMEVVTRKATNLLALTASQLIVVASCAGLWLLWEAPPRNAMYWAHIADGVQAQGLTLLYLSVVATAGIVSLQAWGQRYCSANEAAVIYAFEPACAAIAAYFWLDEVMTWRGVMGAVLLIVGMIVSQWNPVGKTQLVPTG